MTRMTGREKERAARDALLAYLRQHDGGVWIPNEAQPDKIVRDRPMYDFELVEDDSGREAALEVTSFEWPMAGTSSRARLRKLVSDLEAEYAGLISGSYSIFPNINHYRSSKASRQRLRDWLPNEGATQPVGSTARIPNVKGLSVTRLSDSGPFEFKVTGSSARTVYPDWMNDLELVLTDNAAKFEGIVGKARWLLVIFPGASGKFEITGPTLNIPNGVDELYFVDYWPPASRHILDYRTVREPAHRFDRETGAVTVRVPYPTD